MKITRIAALAALVFSASLTCSATAPTFTDFGIIYFRTAGPALIEYWIDAYDVDNDLTSLTTWAYFENEQKWVGYGSTGDGSHLTSHGWTTSYSLYPPCHINITDTEGVYYYEIEMNPW
ncbi:MAG TPA: hypothetical protein VFT72_01095 [Opitutaceae bacterium]|nr:hypothetical protein [Opitutaceae bacterium]